MTRRGRYIALEGFDGSGKSTQAALLAAARDAVLTREPGGTPLGEALRGALLHADAEAAPAPRTEALLFCADRAQHLASVVAPALESGRDVVTDRSYGSTLAYQGYGRGLPLDELRELIDYASRRPAGASGELPEIILPDMVVLLDVPLADADRRVHRLDRLGGEQMTLLEPDPESDPESDPATDQGADEPAGDGPDRLEGEELEFALRVWRSYRELCDAEGDRWVRVDATGSVDDVAARVAEAVSTHPAMAG
ncbi:dTMP kinase [Candidatus Poriferisodalis sp.]|uniref:dTMP kinase n=1 Tax=Candidatus Poriferisodalis sp. TaxID=3101277 RepID=UPI003B021CA9